MHARAANWISYESMENYEPLKIKLIEFFMQRASGFAAVSMIFLV